MRTAKVFSFIRRRAAPDWSAQDIAEFYRVEAILTQSGLRVSSTRGLTDEGDPWFVFCRAEDEEVIIHFARIDGRYVISSPAYCGNASGYDFPTLVRDMIERHPVLRPKPSGENLFLHPAALLVMLVATAFLKSGHAEAAPGPGGATTAGLDPAVHVKSRAAAVAGISVAPAPATLDASQETLLLSAINAAIVVSAPEHILLAAASPAPLPYPEVSDQPLTPSAGIMALNKAHDAQTAVSSGMSPAPSPQSAIVAPRDLAGDAPAHAGSPNDAVIARLNAPETSHYQPAPEAPALPMAVAPVGEKADASANVHHVSLSALPDIPQADKVLLLALGVPDMVAYTASAPAPISTVIHAGEHKAAVNAVSSQPTSADQPTSAAPSSDTVNGPPETVKLPAPAASSGTTAPQIATAPAAVPDIMAVMHIVQLFQSVEIQPTVLLNDHGAIFYDAYAINTQYSAVRSVTYDFGDGFSISLVGLPGELTYAGAHV